MKLKTIVIAEIILTWILPSILFPFISGESFMYHFKEFGLAQLWLWILVAVGMVTWVVGNKVLEDK